MGIHFTPGQPPFLFDALLQGGGYLGVVDTQDPISLLEKGEL